MMRRFIRKSEKTRKNQLRNPSGRKNWKKPPSKRDISHLRRNRLLIQIFLIFMLFPGKYQGISYNKILILISGVTIGGVDISKVSLNERYGNITGGITFSSNRENSFIDCKQVLQNIVKTEIVNR